jgi:hypothetical protein
MISKENLEKLVDTIIYQYWDTKRTEPHIEIITKETEHLVCYVDIVDKGEALVQLLLAIHQIFIQMQEIDNSYDYIIPGHEGNNFIKAFREFVAENAGE